MSPHLLAQAPPGSLFLLETRNRDQRDMLLLATALSKKTGAIVLDGGNHFNAYSVTRAARFDAIDLCFLNTLIVARAFNCHQIVTLSKRIPQDGTPCLIIDALDTFQDENIPFSHRIHLLKKMLYRLKLASRQAAIFISLTPPKENQEQWSHMAFFIRGAANHILSEGFMGKTLPTLNQIIQQAEVILAHFSHITQPREREAVDLLFVNAKKHIAAISEANHLIPFETALQAMLLEQQKEIIELKEKLYELDNRLGRK